MYNYLLAEFVILDYIFCILLGRSLGTVYTVYTVLDINA